MGSKRGGAKAGQRMRLARARAFGELLEASHLMTWEQLPHLVARHAAAAGWPDAVIYLADLQQERLYRLPGEPAPGPEEREETDEPQETQEPWEPKEARQPQESAASVAPDEPARAADRGGVRGAGPVGLDGTPAELAVDGTLAGRVFQRGEVCTSAAAPDSASAHVWIPLVDGTERIGVLRVGAPGARVAMDADLGRLAALVAMLVVSKRATSDAYARLVRRRRMRVAAEMEWRLMPARTHATDRVLISAVMEPAYDISGDAFDYALAGDVAHLALFDAMGHDTAAGLTVNLAVAASRNQRRLGAGMAATAEAVDRALAEQFDGARYATGLLSRLHLGTGVLSWISLGHPLPILIRDGRVPIPLAGEPAPPTGLGLGLPPTVCRGQLEPGDRLVVYSDGITEARNPQGEEFGVDRLVDFLIRHHADGLPVPETLRRLIRHHLEYHHGRLGDDATIMLLEWHGPTAYSPAALRTLVGLPHGG